MNFKEHDLAAYANELDAWVSTFLTGRTGSAPAQLDRRTRHLLRMFSEGNQEKRRQMLEQQLEFLKPAFEGLADLLDDYVRTVPLGAHDVGIQDPDRFLRWLDRRRELKATQRDYVVCQRARHKLEHLARKQRFEYMRFLERWSLVQELLAELAENPELRLTINPIISWARFTTSALLGDSAKAPAMVLFHAFREEVRVSVPSTQERRLLREIARLGPVTLEQCALADANVDRNELLDFAQRWAVQGVLAIA